jgi:hypothetical protein
MSTTFPLEMAYVFCGSCGIPYGVPLEYLRMKETCVYCPNGHENEYDMKDEDAPEVEKDSAKVQELRRDLMRAVHDREQAEARATDAKVSRSRKARGGEAA